MITEISSDRLVVISDLHLGNPFCKTKRQVIGFLHWAAERGYDICINGDGFEIAQVSFHKLAQDVPEVLHALKSIARKGRNIYYVVGNHDIAFEHFLDDWGNVKMAPFLNVSSAGQRIRIEHGHLYDPFFVRYPRLYEFATWFGGVFLQVSPALYRLWIAFEKFRSYRRAKKGAAITGESPSFATAAHELARRGFDHVVFGHTHHVGQVELGGGKTYLNPGSWMIGCSYVEIRSGRAELRRWDGRDTPVES